VHYTCDIVQFEKEILTILTLNFLKSDLRTTGEKSQAIQAGAGKECFHIIKIMKITKNQSMSMVKSEFIAIKLFTLT